MDVSSFQVADFLGSPRHGHYFRVNRVSHAKIATRLDELRGRGRVSGKTPIVNFQKNRGIVEMHDGNASAVAWLLYAREKEIPQTLGKLMEAFDDIILLRDRIHSDGEVWHPFVPPEVSCAAQLQTVIDHEQSRVVPKAITHDGRAVYFDEEDFFFGEDACETIGAMADDFLAFGR
jgi:hypothetical protein